METECDDRYLWCPGISQGLADEPDIIGGSATTAGLGDETGTFRGAGRLSNCSIHFLDGFIH